MKRSLMAAIVVGLTLAFVAPSPAAASPTGRCISGQCGQVANQGPGRLTIRTTMNQVSLAANTRSSSAYDWDAVFIPAGKCVYRHAIAGAVKICAGYKVGVGTWTPVSNGGITVFSTTWS